MASTQQGLAPRPKRTRTAAVDDTRGERTRKLIKVGILRLLARKDVAEVTLSDICRAARLTTGAVYFHFKGKDAAVEEAVVDEVRDLYAKLTRQVEGLDFDGLIARVVAHSSEYHRARKRLPRAIQVVINTRAAAYDAWLAARTPLLTRAEEAIAEARAARGLDAGPAPFLAHFILNSIEDLDMDVYQWGNPTLAAFAQTAEDWTGRQAALWSWAVLAPFKAD